jgi:hypothetical protein
MQTRSQIAAIAILVLAPVVSSFAEPPPLNSQQPGDVPAAPAPPPDSDAEKKRKADAIAAQKAAKARLARCRLHPETCRQ